MEKQNKLTIGKPFGEVSMDRTYTATGRFNPKRVIPHQDVIAISYNQYNATVNAQNVNGEKFEITLSRELILQLAKDITECEG